MKILFTGASSFTGMHFVEALVKSGHDVTPVFTKADVWDYRGVAFNRVKALERMCKSKLVNVKFGDHFFLRSLERDDYDVVCHHASETTRHDSDDFNIMAAVHMNTLEAREVMRVCARAGVQKFIYTDSYAGKRPGSPAFSPYGLSKTFSNDVLEYWATQHKVQYKRFVVPNPFGRWENERMTTSAIRTWGQGEKFNVVHPYYERDNIPVDLLARCYARFIDFNNKVMDPSYYTMSQWRFAVLFAEKMRDRLGLACEVDQLVQVDFREPMTRFNTLNADVLTEGAWSEVQFWDELADYYAEHVLKPQ